MRRALFALTAVTMGITLAAIPVGMMEAQMRAEEAETGLQIAGIARGRKYGLDPAKVPGLNSDGFNDDPWVLEKADGVTRVVLLGDSVAFGSGLPKERVFAQQAETLLSLSDRPIEILNLSIYGYDVQQIAATANAVAWDLEPDLVVYAWFTNDHIRSDLLQVGDDKAPIFVGTVLPQAMDPPAGAWLAPFAPRSAVIRRYLGAHVSRYRGDNKRDRDDPEFFETHLDALVADAETQQVPLLVYGLAPHVLADPDVARCSRTVGQAPSFCARQLERYTDTWRQMNGKGLAFVPALPWLRSGTAHSYFRDGTTDDPHHPNAAGHLLLARGLADLVTRWMGGVDLMAAHPPPARTDSNRQRREPVRSGGAGQAPADERSPSRASRDQLDL